MLAFTICSNNYLAKAQVLACSIKQRSPAEVLLVLADEPSALVDYKKLGFDAVIFAADLGISNLQWMKEKYNVIEFNTALKPFAFQYLMQKRGGDLFYYFDPDIKVYETLESFTGHWKEADIVLTPHTLSSLPYDGKFPGENLFLNHGTFNLGFVGIRRSETGKQFLQWWSDRMKEHCIIDLRNGYFVDQIWCNLVPVYYKSRVQICHHPGWNMAYWNLHERQLHYANGKFTVNGLEPLYFYHFSNFDSSLQHLSPVPQNARYSFATRPDILQLYKEYHADMGRFSPEQYMPLQYFGGRYPVVAPPLPLYRRVARRLKKELENQRKK